MRAMNRHAFPPVRPASADGDGAPKGKHRIFARGFSSLALAAAFFFAACGGQTPLTQVSAGNLAAQLANETCSQKFGAQPFRADDFEARAEGNQWYWGSRDGGAVDGYGVHVRFDKDGGHRQVQLIYENEETDSL